MNFRRSILLSVSAFALFSIQPAEAANQCKAITLFNIHLDCGHDPANAGGDIRAEHRDPPPGDGDGDGDGDGGGDGDGDGDGDCDPDHHGNKGNKGHEYD